MPEAPETRIFRDWLASKIRGKQLNSVQVRSGRYLKNGQATIDLQPLWQARATNVVCKGKLTAIHFTTELDNSLYLLCTLGMTGSWSSINTKHTRVSFSFDGDGWINFNDIRNFGTLKIVTEENYSKRLVNLGIDVLSRSILELPITDFELVSALRNRSSLTAAQLLMRQDIFCGIGNYLKAEILYGAKISPHRLVGEFTTEQLRGLTIALNTIPLASYRAQGASLSTYRTPDGDKGAFTNQMKVYKRKTDLLGNQVIREMTADKRTTWWCPTIQL